MLFDCVLVQGYLEPATQHGAFIFAFLLNAFKVKFHVDCIICVLFCSGQDFVNNKVYVR